MARWRAVSGLAGLWVLASLGCSPGPGRPPLFGDEDGGFFADAADEAGLDAGSFDVEAFEVGDVAVGIADFGVPPDSPFTGVFGARGAVLYAREWLGELVVVVAGSPFVYSGTIDEAGAVELRGAALERGGCPDARLEGEFSRRSATFELLHRTCGAAGPVESTLVGGFARDFEPALSGVYFGRVRAVFDPLGCAAPVAPQPVWALHVLADGAAQLVSLSGPLEPLVYFGRISNGRLALFADVVTGPAGQQLPFQGSAAPAAAQRPAGLSGRRAAWFSGCVYEEEVELERAFAP